MGSPGYKSRSNWDQKLVQFTMGDAERISKAVRAHEKSRRQPKPSVIPRAVGGGGGVRTATFTGQWLKGEEKIINFSGSETARCANIMVDVLGFSGQRKVFVTRGGDSYTLLTVECG